ncbi:MAG: hypothetical protein KF787_00795 [Phycisphaeraceae bacterium]|nr:hypothetical protein [Phycisphaerae bacterium]MBX3391160.1 hypothetical protein [Phycisphaeraceae bacterium]HRJ48885.1 iron-sulfur cluster co-chaperone HscB C-terminal domain-containing protein [Phycisphaerales bacterium]
MNPAVTANPFQTLGVPESMDLSTEQVESAALAMSVRFHPDAAGGDTNSEAMLAGVNHALGVLRNPETRAIALLELRGGPSASQDRTLPDGFLADMMEARERIEESVNADNRAEIERWKAWARARRAVHEGRVAELFRASGDAGSLRCIRHELNAWRYIERLIEQLP